MKYVSILGATGSVGTQTLDIVRQHPEEIKVCAVTGNNNIELLKRQIAEFKPDICCVMNEKKALTLKNMLPANTDTEIVSGMEGLIAAAEFEKSEIIVTAVSGMIGLKPTVAAIKKHKTIALANKETLVTGGNYIMSLAKEYNSKILPVDSEHSAIFQCLMANDKKFINKIVLTASGGPFRGKDINFLKNANAFWVLSLITFLFGVSTHRGFTHSIVGFLSIMAIMKIYKLDLTFPNIYHGFSIGYVLHLVADFFTPMGIKLFYPLNKYISSPITFKTNGKFERIIFMGISFYSVFLLLRYGM